jgi:hypothetical protein
MKPQYNSRQRFLLRKLSDLEILERKGQEKGNINRHERRKMFINSARQKLEAIGVSR